MANEVTRTAEKTPADAPETTHGGRIYRPLTDIVETGDGVTLMLEIPGVAADEVHVTLEKRVLTIQGKVRPTSIDKLDLAYAEYGEGDFERVFTMSDDFDPERIEAQVQNGVLTLRLPRAAAAQPKKITVKAA